MDKIMRSVALSEGTDNTNLIIEDLGYLQGSFQFDNTKFEFKLQDRGDGRFRWKELQKAAGRGPQWITALGYEHELDEVGKSLNRIRAAAEVTR